MQVRNVSLHSTWHFYYVMFSCLIHRFFIVEYLYQSTLADTMNDGTKCTDIAMRCTFAESDIRCLMKVVTKDIAACLNDVKRLRAALLRNKDFAESNCDEIDACKSHELLSVYTLCDELAGGLKKKLRRLDSMVSEELEECKRHLESILELSESYGIHDQYDHAASSEVNLAYDSPLVDTD